MICQQCKKKCERKIVTQRFCSIECWRKHNYANKIKPTKFWLHGKEKERRKLNQTRWRKNNPEKVKKLRRAWYTKYPLKVKKMRLIKTLKDLGMKKDDYNKIYDRCQGVCESCGKKNYHKLYERLCLDHWHDTGKFRGYLCHRCNSALGMLGDSKTNVLLLLNYITKKEAGNGK